MSRTLALAVLLVLPAAVARADDPDAVGDPAGGADVDKPMIKRGIKGGLKKIEYCYEKQLLVDPALEGTVRATFTIAADGKVVASTAKGMHEGVASCVAQAISTIRFDKPSKGPTVVKYPFVFHVADTPPPSNGTDDDRMMIRSHIKSARGLVALCYERQLLKHPTLAGTVTVKFTIGADGNVTSATGSGLHPEVDGCVAAVIKKIVFDKPSKGTTEVNYPFVFKAADTDGATKLDADKLLVRRAIHRYFVPFRYCYEKRLLEQPGLSGTVRAKFTIDPDGKVSASTATGVDDQLASCIATVIKGVVFDPPGKPLEINYPFVFHEAE